MLTRLYLLTSYFFLAAGILSLHGGNEPASSASWLADFSVFDNSGTRDESFELYKDAVRRQRKINKGAVDSSENSFLETLRSRADTGGGAECYYYAAFIDLFETKKEYVFSPEAPPLYEVPTSALSYLIQSAKNGYKEGLYRLMYITSFYIAEDLHVTYATKLLEWAINEGEVDYVYTILTDIQLGTCQNSVVLRSFAEQLKRLDNEVQNIALCTPDVKKYLNKMIPLLVGAYDKVSNASCLGPLIPSSL